MGSRSDLGLHSEVGGKGTRFLKGQQPGQVLQRAESRNCHPDFYQFRAFQMQALEINMFTHDIDNKHVSRYIVANKPQQSAH